jgi:hypothetical protein
MKEILELFKKLGIESEDDIFDERKKEVLDYILLKVYKAIKKKAG